MKPIIALTAVVDDDKKLSLLPTYAEAIERSGGAPLILPFTESDETFDGILALCDGVCFTGGADIDPSYFGEETKETCGTIQKYRDEYELKFFDKAYKAKKPILGICRGAQVINVALGGSLYQDINSEITTEISHRQSEPKTEHSHYVNIVKGTPLYELVKAERIQANSFHHQSAKEIAPSLKLMATADDGVIEALYGTEDVYVRAYQWHPERLCAIDNYEKLIFDDFIAESIRGKKH